MALPTLPPKYYLAHFFELISFLEVHSAALLDDVASQFIADFRALSEDSQCVYVRMVNRRGHIFKLTDFRKYPEIGDPAAALDELQARGFAGPPEAVDSRAVLEHLSKVELRAWLKQCGQMAPASAARQQLLELALPTIADGAALASRFSRIARRRNEALEYLMFLYFGKVQKTLTLYALRDLGIRASGTLKQTFRSRFDTQAEATAEFFFARWLDRLDVVESTAELCDLIDQAIKKTGLRGSTQIMKDELLLKLAERLLPLDGELALKALVASGHPDARMKAVRQLFRTEKVEQSRDLLEQILESPRNDVELLIAEDFLARKFENKKVGALTETLRSSGQIELSDFYRKKPELGVCESFRRQGYSAEFTENGLWRSLFGVLLWDELFDSPASAIHNPFDRSPADLIGPDFYSTHRSAIEAKLGALRDEKESATLILKSVMRNFGRLNDIFQWHPAIAKQLLDFVRATTNQDVAGVLRLMAQQFGSHSAGFPDLMLEKDGRIRFVEVKAEGDSLRAEQLAKLRLLKEAGFDVEVLRVAWKTDPNQIYTVIDVETTGGSATFHRVTEIGVVKVQNGIVIEEFQTLINPERAIPAAITRLTGISNEMVADAPCFSDISKQLLELTESAVFVAHNVRFDYGFIQREFSRTGAEFVRPLLCTCAGMRKAFPGIASYGLKNLTEHFQISLQRHHRALDDARAAAELLVLMNSKRQPELAID